MDEPKPIQEKDQLKRLDWVLFFMAKHAYDGFDIEAAWKKLRVLHPTLHIEGKESYRHQIFEKLINDGFLRKDVHGLYWITLEGIIFNGYQYQKEMEVQKILSQRRNARWMVGGTWFAGSGAILLLIFEIYKFLSANTLIFRCH